MNVLKYFIGILFSLVILIFLSYILGKSLPFAKFKQGLRNMFIYRRLYNTSVILALLLLFLSANLIIGTHFLLECLFISVTLGIGTFLLR